MNNPFGALPVVKNWNPGDSREVLGLDLEQLQGTAAYDSYRKLYRIDGMNWQIEGQISRADGQTVYLLRCVDG